MIHDAYTREWDAQQGIRERNASLDKITLTAANFGLTAEFRERGADIATYLYMPNGKKFGCFHKLETALKWAEKWQK